MPVRLLGHGGEGCADVDECAVDNGGCDPLVPCNNLVGSRECAACPSGYLDVNGNGTRCSDINECAMDNGGCGVATCVNTPGSFMCEGCPMGFAPNAEGECVDVDECMTDNGGCDALTRCTNTSGARTCGECPSGYTGTGDTSCMNIDECASDNGGCDETCMDTDGGFMCGCDDGRVLGSDGTSCFEPLRIMPSALPDGVIGETYDESLSASGGNGEYTWRIRSGSLPDDLTLRNADTANPQIAGTPGATGAFTFQLELSDSAGASISEEFTITVRGPALTILTRLLTPATTGSVYSTDISASGGSGTGYSWRISSGTLPRDLTLDPSGTPDTTLSGTPNETGMFQVTITVRDDAGGESSREFTIVVLST